MLLNLIVLRARNPDQLVAFYSGLGMRFENERHGAGPRHHSCRTNGSIFEIYPMGTDDRETTATRIGFAVADLKRACAHVEAGSGQIIRWPKSFGGHLSALVVDPEGHKVELLETA